MTGGGEGPMGGRGPTHPSPSNIPNIGGVSAVVRIEVVAACWAGMKGVWYFGMAPADGGAAGGCGPPGHVHWLVWHLEQFHMAVADMEGNKEGDC